MKKGWHLLTVTVIKKGLRSPEEVQKIDNVYDIHHVWTTHDGPKSILCIKPVGDDDIIIDLFKNTVMIRAKEDEE